ncbi:MAG: 4-hydroxybenzoyl-CoA thioesterase [Streptosporangiales bacterium]|nr:4-hydroxybenzoyl-CoA thioesterase [Streptosporangiales bacterium]
MVTPYEGTGHRPWDSSAEIPAPLRLHETTVSPRWVDYNGHMTESAYLLVVGDSSDAFFRYLGIDEEYRATGGSLYTVETHLHNKREVSEGEPLALSLLLLGHDEKRVHIFQEIRHGESGALVASAEQMLLHVDSRVGKTSPLPEVLQERLAAIRRAHAAVPVPDVVGRPMGLPSRPQAH